MQVEILVPELGDNVTEAVFVAWLKAPGEAVAEGDVVAEIMTDKVNVEVVSPAAGVLRDQRVAADDVVAVGAALGSIAAEKARP